MTTADTLPGAAADPAELGFDAERLQRIDRHFDRYVDDTWPGGLRGFGRWITSEHPTVIAHHGRVRPWLKPTLTHYESVGRAPGFGLFVNKSVGQETISNLRDKLSRR